MKKLFILGVYLVSFILSVLFAPKVLGQQKALVTIPKLTVAVLIDTTTKVVKTFDRGSNQVKYELWIKAGPKLYDCYDGSIFIFQDTLVTGDFVQQGTTGIWKLTPHTNLVSTTKQNILIGNLLLQIDNSIQSILYSPFSNSNYPIKIINTNTGAVYLTILDANTIFCDAIPPTSTWTLFGTSGIKKIIVN
jgi:hypothetical protein